MIQLLVLTLWLLLVPNLLAVDTEVTDVTLSPATIAELHKFKDNRILGLGYFSGERRVVFVSATPLSDVDAVDLKQRLEQFIPAETVDEAKEKELKGKSRLTVDELTELLRLKKII